MARPGIDVKGRLEWWSCTWQESSRGTALVSLFACLFRMLVSAAHGTFNPGALFHHKGVSDVHEL